jgi:threonine/homoserine/homoserine lactone efflux protein
VSLFARGLVIGLAIAAPVGPIGVLCIRRSIAHGRTAGLATGLGAATADAAYGAVAAFGLTAISDVLLDHSTLLRLAAGLVLIALGARTFLATPTPATDDRARGLASAYVTAVALTLANPTTILSFAAVFTGLGLTEAGSTATAATTVAGVFTGSASWWLFLSAAASALGTRVSVRLVNRISGTVIAGFGVIAITSTL